MGKAGKALRYALQTYGISQNKLAIAMGVRASVVNRWFQEQIDPTGDSIAKIIETLRQLNPDAAEGFIQHYLGYLSDDEKENSEPTRSDS